MVHPINCELDMFYETTSLMTLEEFFTKEH